MEEDGTYYDDNSPGQSCAEVDASAPESASATDSQEPVSTVAAIIEDVESVIDYLYVVESSGDDPSGDDGPLTPESILSEVYGTTASMNNPCTAAGFYSVSAAPTVLLNFNSATIWTLSALQTYSGGLITGTSVVNWALGNPASLANTIQTVASALQSLCNSLGQ